MYMYIYIYIERERERCNRSLSLSLSLSKGPPIPRAQRPRPRHSEPNRLRQRPLSNPRLIAQWFSRVLLGHSIAFVIWDLRSKTQA